MHRSPAWVRRGVLAIRANAGRTQHGMCFPREAAVPDGEVRPVAGLATGSPQRMARSDVQCGQPAPRGGCLIRGDRAQPGPRFARPPIAKSTHAGTDPRPAAWAGGFIVPAGCGRKSEAQALWRARTSRHARIDGVFPDIMEATWRITGLVPITSVARVIPDASFWTLLVEPDPPAVTASGLPVLWCRVFTWVRPPHVRPYSLSRTGLRRRTIILFGR